MDKKKPKILSEKEIAKRLPKLRGWSYIDNKLSKEYEFKTFMESIGFIEGLAPFFESVDHHADMHIYYSKIVFELQRFDVGGKVTDRDFKVAGEIEKRFRALR